SSAMMLSRPGLHCRPSGTRAIHQCCIAGDGAFVAPQPRVAGPGDATRRTLLAIAAIAAFQSRRTDALANVGFTKELKKRRLSPDDYTNNGSASLAAAPNTTSAEAYQQGRASADSKPVETLSHTPAGQQAAGALARLHTSSAAFGPYQLVPGLLLQCTGCDSAPAPEAALIALLPHRAAEAVGLPVVDLEAGRGQAVKLQDRVVVHYDCIYRGVDVVSSRSARLLGGNRTIAEPYEFVVGQPVLGNQAKKGYEGAGGLFSGSSGPKPPPALSKAVLGMKRGGRRSILVDKPELGYPAGEQVRLAGLAVCCGGGHEFWPGLGWANQAPTSHLTHTVQLGVSAEPGGARLLSDAAVVQEIPDGATFELKVEVLDVFPA
ncbi:hypothetical protein QJQ45_019639, partial [Haematococcus lacustris]